MAAKYDVCQFRSHVDRQTVMQQTSEISSQSSAIKWLTLVLVCCFCRSTAAGDNINYDYRLATILNNDFLNPSTKPAFEYSIEVLKKQFTRFSNASFRIEYSDDGMCKSQNSLDDLINVWMTNVYDVTNIIGTPCNIIPTTPIWDVRLDAIVVGNCEETCSILSLFGNARSVPVLSYGCRSTQLQRQVYPTLRRITASYTKLVAPYLKLFKTFGWRRVDIVYTDQDYWMDTAFRLFDAFVNNSDLFDFDSATERPTVYKMHFRIETAISGEMFNNGNYVMRDVRERSRGIDE